MSMQRPRNPPPPIEFKTEIQLFEGMHVTLYSNNFPKHYDVTGVEHSYNIERVPETDINNDDVLRVVGLIDTMGHQFVCSTASTFTNPFDVPTNAIKPVSYHGQMRRADAGVPGNLPLAFSTCCAYSALVMSYIFYKAFKICNEPSQDTFLTCVKKVFTKFTTTNYSNTPKNINNHKILVEIEFLHMGINGYNGNQANVYGNDSIISRISSCPRQNVMPEENGVYLFSIVSEIYPSGGCGTAHHFILYIIEEYCIIYDTWLGGSQGSRCNWSRVISKTDFRNIFNIMNDMRYPPEIKEQIILAFFAGPNKPIDARTPAPGYHDTRYNYQFRYYHPKDFQLLLDLNEELVNRYVVANLEVKYDPLTQQRFQSIVFDNDNVQRFIRQQQDLEREKQGRRRVKAKFPQPIPMMDPSVPVQEEEPQPSPMMDASVPVQEEEPQPSPMMDASVPEQTILGKRDNAYSFDDFNLDEEIGRGGGSRKLKKNKRKTKRRNKRKSKRKNKNKTKRRNINNK